MNNCVHCGNPTQQKFCMAAPCRNKYKTEHYRNNKERYRVVKTEEQKRNGAKRKPQRARYSRTKYYTDFIGAILSSAKERAKTYSLEFDLDRTFVEELYGFQNKMCALTGMEFQFERTIEHHKRRPFAPSLDRIDYDKGYTKDNVRIVCTVVNIALSDFGDSVFDKMCRAYVQHKDSHHDK